MYALTTIVRLRHLAIWLSFSYPSPITLPYSSLMGRPPWEVYGANYYDQHAAGQGSGKHAVISAARGFILKTPKLFNAARDVSINYTLHFNSPNV